MNPNIYPIHQNSSKPGRTLVEDIVEMMTRYSRIGAAFSSMEQQKDTGFGTLTTRTDDNTGVVTLNDDEVVPTVGSVVDVFWDESTTRSTMKVTAVDGFAVSVDGGTGTNLPTVSTVVRLVHFTSMAEVYRFVADLSPDGDTPSDGGVAYRAFAELQSFLGNSAAFEQAAARFRQ